MNNEPLQLVRGQRILQELSSLDDLESNIERAYPTTTKRQHITNTIQLHDVELIPYIGTKLLHVRSTTTSPNNASYKQAVQLLGVTFVPEPTDTSVAITDYQGNTYHMEPVTLADHNVKVRCNCLDFYHRFASYNKQDKSLAGPPPKPYQRKTTDRPPVNPLRVPGICKHLLKLTDDLQRQGIIE